MKFECKCGEIVVDTEVTQKYKWMTTADWIQLLDTVDAEIEKIEKDSMKEAAIMKIRYALKTKSVWECPICNRLVALKGGEVVYFRRESVSRPQSP